MQLSTRQTGWLILLISVVILLVLLLYLLSTKIMSPVTPDAFTNDVTQVAALTNERAPFAEFSDLFTVIAEEKGGEYAFNVMRASPFPFGLDLHLLGHVVGDIMYLQEGIDGMSLCTHEFRNACSHTMVIGALIDFGVGAFPDIREACYDAPGGRGAYTMCFHGLGHGVLAFNEYDMERTIAMCEELGTEEYNDREAVECFGGAVMEIIGGGGHDRDIWTAKRAEYLDPADPYGLCFGDIVPLKYKAMCYNYMTPFAYESFGANMARPSADVFDKTFELCARIPEERTQERWSCYGGQGKEFIGIATGRDFTPDFVPSTEQLQEMYDWCALAEAPDGREYCVLSTMNSLYWGGEQPYHVALEYCSLVADQSAQRTCYEQLIDNVSYYINDPVYHQQFCDDMTADWQGSCREWLKVEV